MSQKTEKTIHSQNKYTFFQSGPLMMNFKLLLQIYHNETTSDHEMKWHIRQRKENEDCSRGEVPYVILMI
jgi:hypothetical protein